MADIQILIQKLKDAEASWSALSALPEDLLSVAPGVTKSDVAVTIASVRTQLEAASELDDSLNPIYFQQISTQILNLNAQIKQVGTNPAGNIPGLLTILYTLCAAVDVSLIDTTADKISSFGYIERFRSKFANSLAKSDVASERLRQANELGIQNKQISEELARSAQTSQEVLTIVQERDRNTAEASGRIAETEKKTLKLSQDLEVSLSEIARAKKEVEEQASKLSEMSVKLEKKLIEAQQSLEDANRIGLAGAFKTRKKELSVPAIVWAVTFVISMLSLAGYAYFHLADVGSDLNILLLRLPVSGPIVWLGWFAVKQYGYTRKMQEDYAFKVASAMSFQGYKNEVTAEPELLKQLRQSAIENFSQNPLRIYSDTNNHGSPGHEILDRVTDEASLQKYMDIVRIWKIKK